MFGKLVSVINLVIDHRDGERCRSSARTRRRCWWDLQIWRCEAGEGDLKGMARIKEIEVNVEQGEVNSERHIRELSKVC